MKLLFYFLGLLPSIIWLLFYLRQDKRPEPNRMVILVFAAGILAAFSAILLEILFQSAFEFFSENNFRYSLLAIFLGGAFIEEIVKFLAVKFAVFRNQELDEPFDLILYMIIAALGFAALENVLVLANNHPILTASKTFELLMVRFVSATFLHALASGILGYFIAKGFFHLKRKYLYFFIGLSMATILHGSYNWAIINLRGKSQFLMPFIIIVFSCSTLTFFIKKVKNKTGACLIKDIS